MNQDNTNAPFQDNKNCLLDEKSDIKNCPQITLKAVNKRSVLFVVTLEVLVDREHDNGFSKLRFEKLLTPIYPILELLKDLTRPSK